MVDMLYMVRLCPLSQLQKSCFLAEQFGVIQWVIFVPSHVPSQLGQYLLMITDSEKTWQPRMYAFGVPTQILIRLWPTFLTFDKI